MEPSEKDLNGLFEGIDADLANPNRIELDRIKRQIEELKHRRDYASELHEHPHIDGLIRDLKARLTELSGDSS